MKTVALSSGETVPALGMGAWNIGDDRSARAEEIATLRLGLDLGASLIDTAEMYGDGRSEELIGEALAALRRAGKIRHYGVSNLDLSDMQELCKAAGGAAVAAN